MASIEELKNLIDLHDLADKLGLTRPQATGNYRSPHHDDKAPSLSVYAGGTRWKDHSQANEGGDCIALAEYVLQCTTGEAIKHLHELYGLPLERPQSGQPQQKKSTAEYIADQVLQQAEKVRPYLTGRGISDAVIDIGIKARALGWNTWTSPKIEAGQVGHGGDAAAFVVKSLNPGRVMAVDMRFTDPDLNGGVKTQSQGEKSGYPWFLDLQRLRKAETVYVVESAINALSIETCGIPRASAVAVRGGPAVVDQIDWSWFKGKRLVLAFDNDEPDKFNRCAGNEAAWATYDCLAALNMGSMLIDQSEWEHNDLNDILQAEGPEELRYKLNRQQFWAIPGTPGDDSAKGRRRVFLPSHDFAQYWRFRVKEDFTTYVKDRREDDDGVEQLKTEDLAGFRIASLSRVTIAGAGSVMSGDPDHQPKTLFAATVQIARHGPNLVRRVFEDEQLHNTDHWRKFGPVFLPSRFHRLVNILERAADLGARKAVNFVGLCWADQKLKLNEGPDCYFTEPEKQCPYARLMFPSGSHAHSLAVIEAYHATFAHSAALIPLVWGLGGHLKAILGFWPHMVMQADKGAGKSVLTKRLERTIGMTMFSRQTLNTEFRLLTSVSHTSQPVGWEEISAGHQNVIDKAVAMLQECYQYTVTRRGSEMTEFLLSAPVMLAGEDVPVKSLTGKLVQTDLTGKKGPLMPDDLPAFPVRQWIEYLSSLKRDQVRTIYNKALQHAQDKCRAPEADDGARRMVNNYAALLTAWRLLTDFADIPTNWGSFVGDLVEVMNNHIAETKADREPWVWIMDLVFSQIAAGKFRYPYQFDDFEDKDSTDPDPVPVLFIRAGHIMDHISTSMELRDKWNALPVKSKQALKRQLTKAGVVLKDDGDKQIKSSRVTNLLVLSLPALAQYGLHPVTPDEPSQQWV